MEFTVVLSKRIDPGELASRTESTLQRILNLEIPPGVAISASVVAECLERPGDTVTLRIDDQAQAVATVMDLPFDDTNPWATRRTVFVDTGGFRTEKSWTLAIAAAIAVAEILGAKLTDDALLLSSELEADPAALVERLALPRVSSDLAAASHALLSALELV